MFRKLLLTFAIFSTSSWALDPTDLKIKVYKVSFSTSDLCTNPVTVLTRSESDATYVDFLDSPALAENVSLDDGTYKCIIIEMSDIIKFSPASTSGSCTAGTEYTLDVCRGTEGGTYTLTDGTEGTCNATRGTEDHVALYISTGASSAGGGGGSNAFMPPTSTGDSTHGINLTSAFVKAGAATGIFYVDGTGKVEAGADCDMQPPAFGFR